MRDTESGLYIAEPRRNGMRDTTFNFDVARYSTDTFLDNVDAGAAHYASLKFASGNYNFGIYFDYFRFEDGDAPVTGPEIIRSKYMCRAHKPPSGTDNFSADRSNINLYKDNEMYIILTDDHSDNYLDEN